jgi:hypothetical protein
MLGADLLLLGRHPPWVAGRTLRYTRAPLGGDDTFAQTDGDSRLRRGCVERPLIMAMRNQALALNSQRSSSPPSTSRSQAPLCTRGADLDREFLNFLEDWNQSEEPGKTAYPSDYLLVTALKR